jgi:hypothetical protein
MADKVLLTAPPATFECNSKVDHSVLAKVFYIEIYATLSKARAAALHPKF